MRQVDGANNGERFVKDERRLLYQEFLKYVEFFQPKVFVMENVLGIRSASGGEYFIRVQKEARAFGYRVHASNPRRAPATNLRFGKPSATCRRAFNLADRP